MNASTEARLYRFAPLDRSGWLLGLGAGQCLALGVGAVLSGAALNAQAPAPMIIIPLAGAFVFAFARLSGQPLHEIAPALLRYGTLVACRRRTWFADLPLLTGSPAATQPPPDLPPFLAGLVILDAGPVPWAATARLAGVGVVRDQHDGSVSATVRAKAQRFSLCDRGEQERLVANWGEALGAFCRERGAVAGLRWTECAAPAGLDDCLRYLDEQEPAGNRPAVAAYREVLDAAAPLTTGHEILVTVTVDPRRVTRRRSRSADAESAAVDALLEELRLLTQRLEAAGLAVDPPLSPVDLAGTLRRRFDPACERRLKSRARTLAERAGVASPHNAGPLATELSWSHVRVDAALHRTYWMAEWPRLEVPPNWMEPLLLHAGGVRTVSVLYEPVPPGRAQRQIDREATKLASDEEQRARSGFRIGARHRRAEGALLEREAELVAGYAELGFAGFVTVTGADAEQLERSCAEYEQAAARAGLELRPLDGRHDLGLLCALPIGRGLAPRRVQ
jgi:hypothetical protein